MVKYIRELLPKIIRELPSLKQHKKSVAKENSVLAEVKIASRLQPELPLKLDKELRSNPKQVRQLRKIDEIGGDFFFNKEQ